MTARGVTLVEVPYHLGHHGVGVGAGPAHLLDALGSRWPRRRVRVRADHTHEVQASFAVLAAAAKVVRDVKRSGRLPVVFGGNCMTALAACASDRRTRLGAVWFDAHGDFHTPDTTGSGFLDGMALRMLTGGCWRTLLDTVSGFVPVLPKRVTFIGGHDLDAGEEKLLRAAGVHVILGSDGRKDVSRTLSAALRGTGAVYVHVDLDVLAAGDLTANQWARPGGLSRGLLLVMLTWIAMHWPLAAVSITAYDPAWDRENKGPDIVRWVLKALNLEGNR